MRLDGRGPAAARNAGVRAARGRVVLLTDDDCVPAPGWAAALAAAVEGRRAVAVGVTEFDAALPLVAASETIVAHAERRGGFAATRNLAIPRELALAVPARRAVRRGGRRGSRVGAGGSRARERPLVRVDEAGCGTRPISTSGASGVSTSATDVLLAQTTGSRLPGRVRRSTSSPPVLAGARVGALVLVAQAATLLGYCEPPPLVESRGCGMRPRSTASPCSAADRPV